jgi:hypothetical protein
MESYDSLKKEIEYNLVDSPPRKRCRESLKIYYTGIGCNKSTVHTEQEFLDIMNKEFTHKLWKDELSVIPREIHYQLKFKDWVLPDDFTFFKLSDWIEYSGAEIKE